MSNTARKERKRKGSPFVREPKVGTPFEERTVPAVTDRSGRTTGVLTTHSSHRAALRLAKAITIRDLDREVLEEVKTKRRSALKKKAA